MNSPDHTPRTSVDTDTGSPGGAFEQAFDADSLIVLRHSVGAHGSALGLSDDQADDLMLIVQELAANAVRHGPGHGIVRLWRDGDDIVCAVSNPGAAPDGLAEIGLRPPPPGNVGGRGLWLVRQLTLTLALRIDASTDTTTVTAIVRLDSISGSRTGPAGSERP